MINFSNQTWQFFTVQNTEIKIAKHLVEFDSYLLQMDTFLNNLTTQMNFLTSI